MILVKSRARKILKNNYVKALTAMLIALLPLYMIDGATSVLSYSVISLVSDKELSKLLVYGIGYPLELLAGFFLSPVLNGYIRAYYRTIRTGSMELRDVFRYFSRDRYRETLRLNLSFVLRMLLPALLLYLPLTVYEIICLNMGEGFYGTQLYRSFYFILAVLSTVSTTLYSLRYFTVFTLRTEQEQLSVKELFSYSKYIMKHQTGAAAKLIFSFTPWLLLCLLILPMLYVIPYMTQSLCIAADWMTKASFDAIPRPLGLYPER